MSTGWQTTELPKILPRTRPILKISRRPPQEARWKAPAGFFSLLQNMGAYESWWTKITAPSKEQARANLNRVAHVPKIGHHNLLSAKRLTTAFDAPMRVYPAAAIVRSRFGHKTLGFRSLRPETGPLEIKARRRADMKEPLTPLTTARLMVVARANPTSWRSIGALATQASRSRAERRVCRVSR